MCSFLPLGLFLMSMDITYDLGWCLFPSKKTAQSLCEYYTFILTPRLLPPYPGWLFPVYTTYVFLWQCPNVYNWCIFLVYIPVSYRYYRILTKQDDLQRWWFVVLLRALLTLATLRNLQSRGCVWGEYWNDLSTTLTGMT